MNLRIEYSAPVATVSLSRPDIRNAFSDEVIAEGDRKFNHISPSIAQVWSCPGCLLW